jgi:hypothetical protein
VTGDELTDLLVSVSGHVLVLAVLGIDECDRALVEVDEPVAEGLLEDQQGMVAGDAGCGAASARSTGISSVR